jgi:twinkle protein
VKANDLAERLAQQAETVARMLLPDGKREGQEWRCGSVRGEAGDSLGVHLSGAKAGVWRDFSADVGGDLIGLWMAAQGLSLRDACEAAMEFLGIVSDRPMHATRSYRKPAKDGVHRLTPEHAAWLRDVRKIPDATIAAYKLASRGDRLMFPYLRGEELVFAKYRKLPKQFSAEADCEPILFGWQAVSSSARIAIIAEGELDAMAWHAYGFPALSVPTGATGHAWIASEFDWLEPFDTIYLSFDADTAGEKGIAELCERLGRDRCRVVRLPCKDANACLMQGIPQADMAKALAEARTLDPAELRNAADFAADVWAEFNRVDAGLLLPWKKTNETLKLREAELSVWAGINGHGKTSLLSQVIGYLATGGTRCCVASMEWPMPMYLMRMTRQIAGLPMPTQAYSDSIMGSMRDVLWTFNVAGASKADRILAVFDYARRRYGIEFFAIDNLSKCGFDEEDYSGEKQFVEKLADYTRQTHTHIALVAHMRKGESEDKPSGKFGVKGSGGITNMATTVVEVWRNKPREAAMAIAREEAKKGGDLHPTRERLNELMPERFRDTERDGADTLLIVRKQNATGIEKTYRLWYDAPTMQFLAAPHYKPRAMIPVAAMANLGGAA